MNCLLVLFLLFLSGCGALRINPKSCNSPGIWGANPLSTREITREEAEDEKIIDLNMKESFLVFYDRDLRLRDLLNEHKIKCEEVKKIRVEIKTTWFLIRKVTLKVVKI
jgi:hypothetical protein